MMASKLDVLRNTADKLVKLLDAGEYGLSTWQLMFAQTVDDLEGLLQSLTKDDISSS